MRHEARAWRRPRESGYYEVLGNQALGVLLFKNGKRLRTVLIRCLLAACLAAVPALAQTATLRGQVTDESGAVIPGAKVSLSSPAVSRDTTAASDGSYAFTDLPPGDYI